VESINYVKRGAVYSSLTKLRAELPEDHCVVVVPHNGNGSCVAYDDSKDSVRDADYLRKNLAGAMRMHSSCAIIGHNTKKAKWVEMNSEGRVKCSFCNGVTSRIAFFNYDGNCTRVKRKKCPYCLAEMIG